MAHADVLFVDVYGSLSGMLADRKALVKHGIFESARRTS
jgi:hypothetical protein